MKPFWLRDLGAKKMISDESSKLKLSKRIAGEISLSDTPGLVLKKWRDIFSVAQIKLAEHLQISPSVISDYESGRRKSPGTQTIKRFVEALISMNEESGGSIISAFDRLSSVEVPTNVIITISDFMIPVKARDFCQAIKAEPVACEDLLDNEILGYVTIDSPTAIRELSGDEYLKIFQASEERALIFANTSTGRLIAEIREGANPSLIILHGATDADRLAIEAAEKHEIPLAVSKITSGEEFVKILRQFKPSFSSNKTSPTDAKS